MEPLTSTRRARALAAATAIARSYGVECSGAHVLKDANNTIVRLAPSSIVAKVGTATIRAGVAEDRLRRELEIGAHLVRRGAPIAPPADQMPPGPHSRNGLTITFWKWCAQDGGGGNEDRNVAEALHDFHDALRDYRGDLPRFTQVVDHAGEVVADPSLTPTLRDDDRRFLEAVHERNAQRLALLEARFQPLHGEPHLNGNVLLTREGPRFVDFEAACTGPPEWDLTSLPDEVARYYLGVDLRLLDFLRGARSLCVAAWSWMHPERDPEVREAEFHLHTLRERTDPL